MIIYELRVESYRFECDVSGFQYTCTNAPEHYEMKVCKRPKDVWQPIITMPNKDVWQTYTLHNTPMTAARLVVRLMQALQGMPYEIPEKPAQTETSIDLSLRELHTRQLAELKQTNASLNKIITALTRQAMHSYGTADFFRDQ